MISVIVCSIKPPEWTLHERNVAKTVSAVHEYIRVDNRNAATGICSVYNRGARQARGDILVFVHEDVFFMEQGWGGVLERKFSADPSVGLVGVAGTQYLCADKMSWNFAGRPFLKGRVVHELDGGKEFFMTAFSLDKADAGAVAVDGLFFAVRRDLFKTIRFDEETFDKYHFYDLDICMQVRRTHKIMVTWDILVKHLSAGKPDDVWRAYGHKFLEKHKNELPANCSGIEPDFSVKREMGISVDLKGKVTQEIIC